MKQQHPSKLQFKANAMTGIKTWLLGLEEATDIYCRCLSLKSELGFTEWGSWGVEMGVVICTIEGKSSDGTNVQEIWTGDVRETGFMSAGIIIMLAGFKTQTHCETFIIIVWQCRNLESGLNWHNKICTVQTAFMN